MDDIGFWWTVWTSHGKTPGLKTVAQVVKVGPVPWPGGDMGEDQEKVLMFHIGRYIKEFDEFQRK